MRVRKFTDSQLPALLDLVEANSLWGRFRELGRQSFIDRLRQPGLAPHDNCLILEEEDAVEGYCLVVPELPIDRVVLEMQTSPRASTREARRLLVQDALLRARELGARIVHTCSPDPLDRNLHLMDEGFVLARTYWEMVSPTGPLSAAPPPNGFVIRPFKSDDVATLTEVQNAAFGGSWGFCPNTEEQIRHRCLAVDTPKPGILFICHGREPAGYCWTCLVPSEGALRGVIGMIGVLPDYQGKGVSRPILDAGMKSLSSLEVADIRLQVDESNRTAISLYYSAGFEKAAERYWFERSVS